MYSSKRSIQMRTPIESVSVRRTEQFAYSAIKRIERALYVIAKVVTSCSVLVIYCHVYIILSCVSCYASLLYTSTHIHHCH